MEIYVEMLSLHFKHYWKYFKITKPDAHENASLFLFSFYIDKILYNKFIIISIYY